MEQLKLPQIRVLLALETGAVLSRARLSVRAGFSEISGTVTRVLNGLKEGSSSGAAHPGLIEQGLIRRVEGDVDGVVEVGYQITEAGIAALEGVGDLPELRSRVASTNKRYGGEHAKGI